MQQTTFEAKRKMSFGSQPRFKGSQLRLLAITRLEMMFDDILSYNTIMSVICL